MRVLYNLNNYTVGAKLRTAPVHLLVSKERRDRNHTEVIFDLPDDRSGENTLQFMNKLFAKKGQVIP